MRTFFTNKLNIILISFIVLFSIAAAVMGFQLFNNDDDQEVSTNTIEEKLYAKNFVGKTLDEVKAWCDSLNNDPCSIEEEYSDNIGKDIIISQSVLEGDEITDCIIFKVSKGKEEKQKALLLEYDDSTTKQDVENWALENDINNIVYFEEYSDSIAKGKVISIETSENLKGETLYTVYISKGQKESDTKEIIIESGTYLNIAEEEFIEKVEELGLKASHSSKKDDYSDSIKQGYILWHGSGSYIENEEIHYGLSLGENPYTIVVESNAYLNISEEEFIKKAQELSLVGKHLESKDDYSDTIEKGKIIWHGSGNYAENENISYGLSLGEEIKIEVTSFVGKSEAELIKFLNDNKLLAKTSSEYSSTIEKGKIIKNDTGKFKVGSSINYTVSLGENNTVTLANFAGKSEDELLNEINKLSLKVGTKSSEKSSTVKMGYIISNQSGSFNKGDSIAYCVSKGLYIGTIEVVGYICESSGNYQESYNNLTNYFKNQGFSDVTIKAVSAKAESVGVIISISVDGNKEYDAGYYSYDVPIVIELCQSVQN